MSITPIGSSRAVARAVVVLPYAASWAASFQALREELLAAWPPAGVAVEHIGSTSVPGLVAKPVIDVLLGAASLAEIESRIPALAALGYEYIAKYEREIPLRRYFVGTTADSLRVHLHGVVAGSRIWNDHLGFRDALRADPALAARYAALKLRLAEEFARDKAAYTAAKAPFILAVLAGLPSNPGTG
jgi:GrpB-like predicted nucleotidyltransferase (UPF0157 family)